MPDEMGITIITDDGLVVVTGYTRSKIVYMVNHAI